MATKLKVEIQCKGCRGTLIVRRENIEVIYLKDPVGEIPTSVNFIKVHCPDCGKIEVTSKAQAILVSTFSL